MAAICAAQTIFVAVTSYLNGQCLRKLQSSPLPSTLVAPAADAPSWAPQLVLTRRALRLSVAERAAPPESGEFDLAGGPGYQDSMANVGLLNQPRAGRAVALLPLVLVCASLAALFSLAAVDAGLGVRGEASRERLAHGPLLADTGRRGRRAGDGSAWRPRSIGLPLAHPVPALDKKPRPARAAAAGIASGILTRPSSVPRGQGGR